MSICIPRPAGHADTLVFDDVDEGFSLVPWGPVSIWGSTEETVTSPTRCRADGDDVARLLARLNRHTRLDVQPDDVVSIRCGVRGLVVGRDVPDVPDPCQLSKRWQVHVDRDRPWVSVYGGKITSSPSVAHRVAAVLNRQLGRPARPVARPHRVAPTTTFPGMPDPVPTAVWCRTEDGCRTLDDYLRRRTDIAQWVPRGGFGRDGEHRPALLQIAADLHDDAEAAVDAYAAQVERDHDAVLGTEAVTHA